MRLERDSRFGRKGGCTGAELEHVIYEKRERVAYVTINRPHVMNAIHPPTLEELNQVWLDYMDDDEVWVAILTGSGERASSTGADLKYRAQEADEQLLRSRVQSRAYVLDQCWKPIIAAVNGYAVGGGSRSRLAATSS